MRTVEEFEKIVREENQKYNEELLKLNPATLIDRVWEIAKWQAIYDYIEEDLLRNETSERNDFLSLDINSPIYEIYAYEYDYDEPQWTTWRGLDNVVRDMIEEIKMLDEIKKQKN